ncbi:hypothetical protein BaRGS_00026751 [Batillaria attramentaria]|uniref:Cilia- and flagella-associated protein 46 n=1 Tax=Batillaria attramentaria TaxID=370345 RepID=A0ABD0K469_9CAEN
MDISIRSLLSSAQSYKGVDKNPFLQQAYTQLRTVAENRPAVDAPEPFGQDLHVLCAEIAYQYGLNEIAKDCLKMFFMRQQPANQFVIRAYLCQAQLLAPQDANNPEQLDKAVVYLLKAIAMAKKTQRYYFLVYNASVLYWNFCRPFLKPNYRQFLARSLHQVVKALDDIEDTDYEWRAQLMIALIECHLDAGRRSDASHIATAAATFIKQNVPSLYKQVFGLMVRYQLVESSKLHKDVKTSPELSVFYKICKLKNSVDLEESREYYTDVSNILAQIGVSSAPTSSRQERLSRRDTKGTSGRRSPSAHSVSPTGEENTGSTTTRKSPTKGGRRTPTPTSTKKLTAESADRPFLLLELAHLCLDLKFPDLAATCVDSMKTCTVKEQGFYLQLEFLQCLMMVKSLEEKQESYQRPVVDLRLQAIKRCEEAIMNAIRFGDPNVIQAGCVTQWNLCLPLTQPNLRKQIRKPLTLIAEALENIQSLLVQLRCQVHTELARCEEDMEQIQVAMEHLKKALALDDGSAYQERLEVMLRRLELRSQLYRQPERPEDQARTADSGTIRMKRSLLVKAGEALAPDAFLLVLDSESDTKDEAGGRGPLTVMKQLGGKARAFNRCVRKAEGHLKRLGDENDRERARLWADLAKTARKQEVWDVCRVAARFCLLYDDGRWKNAAPKPETPKPERTKTDVEKTKGDDAEGDKKAGSRLGSRPMTPQGVSLYDKDLIRMLAEVNFINGEALVHLLRSEGVQLNDKPIPPEDKRQRPKGYVPKKPEEDPDWTEYCDWIAELSDVSTKSFLRGLQLGVDLIEPWLVCCAATYIWNYNNHILSQNRHREIVPALTTVLDGLKKVGHAGETIMLVNICKALAYGLIAPWFPAPPKEEKEAPAAGSEKAGKGAKLQATPSKIKMVTVSAEAGPDVKKAVEVCEFAIGVTSGDNPQDVVPIAVRQPLLQTWVTAKQMGQQQINKTLGTDDETSTEGQKPMTRAIVATEMLSINKNGIMEFKDTPFIADIAQMVEDCHWTDHFIELQLWTRLTALAYESHMHNLVMRCSKKALRFAKLGTQPKARRKDKHQHMVEQEMLSFASCLQGQSLIDNMAGKNSMRREAMESFLNAARFACNAGNYELVMTAARHYWNASIELVSQPIERELLKEPLKIILECIAATSDKKIKTEEPPAEEKPEEEHKEGEESKEESQDRKEKKLPPPPKKQPAGMIGKPGEDLTLRASMYGVLFQSYADQGEWELALEAMDQAVTDMPRTKHRLLIFKHRVMVKAKLGRSVHMDIAKFKDESEDYVAHMWRRVALSSKELCEQLSSYQNAIESLNSASNEFQKVEYLLEFGQWLYANEFPLQDVLDQIEWAVDILLNVQDEGTLLAKKEGKRSEKGRGKGSARSRFSSSGRKSPGVDLKGKKTSSTTTLDAKGKKVSVSSTMGADTKSEISDQDSEINAADYVPVVKEAIIGVLPINPSLTINDLTDVRQLDACVRAHVLLAELTGRDGACYADILLQAYGYLHRLWQVLLSEAGPAMKEIAKSQTQQVDAGSKGGKGSGKAAKGKEKEAPPVKEKPKRKGPLDAVPEMVEDWAIYDAPEEIVEALQHETMHKTGINENTLPKPMLTMHYLNSLTKQLRDLGYTHLALPVLAFEDLLSRSILKSHALNVLVHARSLEVCQELALKPGCEFHEFVIGNIRIREEDQSVSRQEIALWKEKQVQVSREEMRVKETLARMGTSAKSKDKMPAASAGKQANASKAADDDQMTVGHIGQALGAVCLRQVWADTAEVLIRLGYMQRAREFLNEANIAAEAFSDKPLQGQIMFLFGKLAFEEAQYGQAINFCRKAQDIHEGDEMFWFETTMLIVNSVLHDYSDNKRKHLAKTILVHALNEYQRLTNDRPNRAAAIGFIMTTMEAKLAEIQMDSVLAVHKDVNLPKVMKAVLSVCEKVDDAAEKLVRLGHRREAIPLVIQHASHLMMLARAATEPQVQHAYFLEALSVLGEAESLAEQVYFDALTLTSLNEMRNVSLPVQRELANTTACRGEVLLEVAAVQVKEMRALQLKEQQKGAAQRIVEDYTRQTPTYTPTQRDWLNNRATVFEEATAAFLSAHGLAGHMTDLKARALTGLGTCLHMLAEYKGPDPPPQWLVHEMELLRLQAEAEEAEEAEREKEREREREEEKEKEAQKEGAAEKTDEAEDIGEPLISEDEKLQIAENTRLIAAKLEQHELSKLYLTFATECLTQALNLALANKHTAALELVKCHGQFDPAAASQFLALYQSCQSSLRMEELLYSAQKDPITSKLAALLHQRRSMLRDSLSTNLAHSTLMATVTQTLEKDWQAWKLLEVLPQHMDMLKEFPPNFNFVVLQHSPDKNFLYGAVLDKSKAGHLAGGGGKGNPKHTAASSSRAKVFGIETSPRLLEEIIGKFRQHKASVQAFLLKQEYQRSQATLRQKMLENLDDSLKPPGKMMLEESVDEAEMLEEEFRELVGAMETYLKPIMSFVDSTLRSSYSPTGSTTNIPAQSRQEKDTGHECVILLADADLMELPLEALTCLRADGISALSRDFSLQLLFHRMHQGVSVEALLKEDDKDKKKAKEAAQAVSRIPGARDVKAKQAKIVSSDSMKERKPIDEFNKIMEEYEQQFTPRWLGVPGDDHCPSVGEWEIYLTESSSFIFYGFERLLSYIPPAKMSALNIPDCMILYCLDLAQTSRSFMRQSKVDVDKSREDLLLERPLEAAMLASLTGTRCIMSNQWYCTLEENNNKIILSMKDLLEKGKTTGQSVRLLLNPRKRHEEERALEAAEEQALSQRSDGKEGGKQKKEGSAKSRKDDGSKKDDASKGDAASSVVESGGASHRAEEEGDPDKDKEEPKEDNFSVIQRSWFNMVCYGMPNLIVTQ